MRRGQATIKALTCVVFGSWIIYVFSFIFDPQDAPTQESVKDKQTSSGKNEELGILELKEQVVYLQAGLSRAVAYVEELSCLVRKHGAREGSVCLTKETAELGGYTAWDWKLASELEVLLAEKSVGEFGAGLGWYGHFFLRIQKSLFPENKEIEEIYFLNDSHVIERMDYPKYVYSWKGFDGATFIEQFTGGLVQYLDLSQLVWLEKFDWVISFDAGIRIPARYTDNFISNLARHACKGIVLSWGTLEQHKLYVANQQTNENITDKLYKLGFNRDLEWEDVLQQSAELAWMKYSLMVFRPESESQHQECTAPKKHSKIYWEEAIKKWEVKLGKPLEEAIKEKNESVFLTFK